jgi:hypothetical protein
MTGTLIIGDAPQHPAIRISDARMEDKLGNSVTHIQVGQEVQIVSNTINGYGSKQSFAYLVQIQDASGATVSLSWLTGFLTANQSMEVDYDWTPEAAGSLIVTIYVKDTDTLPFDATTNQPGDENDWALLFAEGDDLAIPVTFEINVTNKSGELVQEEATIPDWIKNNAGWWAAGSIDDDSFLNGISYLIQNGIIVIPPTDAGTEGGAVPEWVKNTAGWWADGTIDDGTFVNAIQYLIKEGLIQV